ncbi:branched-chain amino acid transport system permease protein [Halorubrum aquaticum]|uniref:Branched-chain amino acid transport system permease protein n=1 Tax=Halorubrum aquaticum TaxID=387340 RepID=A0A1I3A1A7_9EURY|nr:branched-chain amino acid ABC transporter permease [Halorubrum aquaticum]SFH43666.1 branched-chain amino acid transport system permease protein [Halorubrum aquaticum]
MSLLDAFDPRETGSSTDGILSNRGRFGILALIAALAVLGPVASAVRPFWLYLLIQILVFALLALSLDFVFGYAGLLSFGHAAMFGTGGYAAALLITHVTANALVVLPAAVLTGVVVAAFIGWFSVRARGIYFAMLTLAFAQIFYVIAFADLPSTLLGVETVTGGDNGIVGLATLETFGLLDLSDRMNYYFLTLGLVALSLLSIVRLANSPFGRVLQGVRENEDRMAFIGYDVRRYKVIGFAISGGFAGLAGGLYVPFQSLAQPQLLNWTLSGELVVMLLLGGLGTLWGPMLGAGVVVLLEEQLSGFAAWEVILGSVFVVVVIFAPRGIAGALVSLWEDPEDAIGNVRDALANYREKVMK